MIPLESGTILYRLIWLGPFIKEFTEYLIFEFCLNQLIFFNDWFEYHGTSLKICLNVRIWLTFFRGSVFWTEGLEFSIISGPNLWSGHCRLNFVDIIFTFHKIYAFHSLVHKLKSNSHIHFLLVQNYLSFYQLCPQLSRLFYSMTIPC